AGESLSRNAQPCLRCVHVADVSRLALATASHRRADRFRDAAPGRSTQARFHPRHEYRRMAAAYRTVESVPAKPIFSTRRLRSSLPFGVSGNASIIMMDDGIMYAGSFSVSQSRRVDTVISG